MKCKAMFSIVTMSVVTAAGLATQVVAQDKPSSAAHTGLATNYTLTDLGPVGPTPGQPFHLTDNGLISGSAAYSGKEQATLWYKRLKANIGMGGRNSIAFGINQWAQAVGEADTTIPDPNHEDFCGFAFLGFPSGKTCVPFIWQDGVMTPLPTLKDKNGKQGNNGSANVINSSGEVAGLAENSTLDKTCPAYDPSLGQTQKLQTKPVVWMHGQIHELPTLGGDPDGVALAINESGLVAGGSGECAPFNPASFLYIQPVHAILWENGKPTDLMSLGGATGNLAYGVNNRAEVAGASDLAGDTIFHGFLWTKETGKMQDLAPFSPDVYSVGLAINDAGVVTGASLDAKFNSRAVGWERGTPVDLNSRISHKSTLYLLLACSINSSGEIIGLAVDTKTGETHGYLASPAGW